MSTTVDPLTHEEEAALVAAAAVFEGRRGPRPGEFSEFRASDVVAFAIGTGVHPEVFWHPEEHRLRLEMSDGAAYVRWNRPKKKGVRAGCSVRLAPGDVRWVRAFIARVVLRTVPIEDAAWARAFRVLRASVGSTEVWQSDARGDKKGNSPTCMNSAVSHSRVLVLGLRRARGPDRRHLVLEMEMRPASNVTWARPGSVPATEFECHLRNPGFMMEPGSPVCLPPG